MQKPSLSLYRAVLFFAFFVYYPQISFTQTCTYPNQTVTAANVVLNTYYPGTASAAANSTSITLGAATGAATAIAAGDLLLIIQMQGATQNSTNTNTYGDGVAGNPASGFLTSTAGTYEYAYATNTVPLAGGTLNLLSPVTNGYINAAATATQGQQTFQVVRIPGFNNLTINAAQSITCTAWNGTTGGVVVLNINGTLNMNTTGSIHANARGFRGGGGRQLGGGAGTFTDFRTNATVNANGAKGEGICGTPRYVYNSSSLVNTGVEGYPNGSNASGAPGNAGGGGTDGNPAGNDENTGGGGGSNGGTGGGGGRSWNSNRNAGGFGGVSPGFLASTRLIMGGGGGAGTNNTGTGALGAGLSSSGAIGGGIIILKVNTITNAGTITANGANANNVDNDGGGGGGAGGTVYISATNVASLTTLTVNARGGNGGNAWATVVDLGAPNDGNPEHGPGGGGGGGVIYSNGSLVASSSAAGGANGVTTTSNLAFGATSGATGVKNQASATITFPSLPVATASSNSPVCAFTTLNLFASPAIAGATYSWTGPGFSSSSQNPSVPAVTTAAAGTYNVSYTFGSCTSVAGSTVVSVPSPLSAPAVITPVCYPQGGTATALTATGSNLLWYTVPSGGTGSGTAPIPSTTSPGTTSYWVSQTATPPCTESRSLIDVIINMQTLAATGATATTSVNSIIYFGANTCTDLIAALNPNGASPVSGNTTAKVWIEAAQPAQYVKRHYEITPAANAATATGRVTLYFTQQEFNDFNAINITDLPANPSDATGKANLLIEKRGGTSSDGSGLPGTYTGTTTTINPADSDIIWNAGLSRWEVSFDVTGFSGFFIKTTSFTLPVTLISFTATKQANNGVLIQWKTNNEQNLNHFEIEKSINGTVFEKTGNNIAALNNGMTNNYQLMDNSTWTGDVRYYRLKSVDNDGRYKYSGIIRVSNKMLSFISVYPNPATDVVMVQTTDKQLLNSTAYVQDAGGKTVMTISITGLSQQVNVSLLPSGIYILHFANGEAMKLAKE